MTPPFVLGLAPADLTPGQIHLWLAPTGLPDDDFQARYLAMLSPAERERHRAFHFERDRHAYLAAHALARLVAGHFAGIAPAEVAFRRGASGKPYLDLAPALGQVGFSLTHTAGMVGCLLAPGMDCGLDVERRRPLDDMDAIARTLFSQAEQRDLATCAPDQREARFYALWTLKEAYAKATGEGIGADLTHLSFGIDEDDSQTVQARFADGHPGAHQQWRFYSRMDGRTHAMAVAARPLAPSHAAGALVRHRCVL